MHEIASDDEKVVLLGKNIPSLTLEQKLNIHREIIKSHKDWQIPYDSFIDLSFLTWHTNKRFSNLLFATHTEFSHCQFNGVYFNKCDFWFPVFRSCKFSRETRFDNCIFYEGAIFSDAAFDRIIFRNCTFKYQVNMSSATLSEGIIFENCSFEHEAYFANLKSNHAILFKNCTFQKEINLEGADIKQSIKFRDVIFESYPPSLVACTIKGDLEISLSKLMLLPARKEDTSKWVKLKYEMNRLHRHQEEAGFFRKELECRATEHNRIKILTYLYKVSSEYGGSALLPLGVLIYSFILFTALYEFWFFNYDGDLEVSAMLSLRSTLPFVPLEKDLIDLRNVWNNFSGTEKFFFQFLRSMHFSISTILLFLIGLGIRNHLRIR